jgi:hypothetical protein
MTETVGVIPAADATSDLSAVASGAASPAGIATVTDTLVAVTTVVTVALPSAVCNAVVAATATEETERPRRARRLGLCSTSRIAVYKSPLPKYWMVQVVVSTQTAPLRSSSTLALCKVVAIVNSNDWLITAWPTLPSDVAIASRTLAAKASTSTSLRFSAGSTKETLTVDVWVTHEIVRLLPLPSEAHTDHAPFESKQDVPSFMNAFLSEFS